MSNYYVGLPLFIEINGGTSWSKIIKKKKKKVMILASIKTILQAYTQESMEIYQSSKDSNLLLLSRYSPDKLLYQYSSQFSFLLQELQVLT